MMPSVFETQMRHLGNGFMPSVDVSQEGDTYLIEADIPQMNPKDISLQIGENNTVILSGEMSTENEVEKTDKQYFHRERRTGSFSRVIQLPQDADLESATSEFSKGTLLVSIPKKSEQSNKRLIDIQIKEA